MFSQVGKEYGMGWQVLAEAGKVCCPSCPPFGHLICDQAWKELGTAELALS